MQHLRIKTQVLGNLDWPQWPLRLARPKTHLPQSFTKDLEQFSSEASSRRQAW